MSTKHKILLSVGAVCLVAVIAVVAIVAVYAASKQQFTSEIHVSYTAHQILGSVKANWYEGSGEAQPMTTDGQTKGEGNDVIEFKAGPTGPDETGELKPTKETIDLSETNKYVVFEYVFTNTGSKAYTAKLTYKDNEPTDSNFDIYIKSDGAKLTTTTWNTTEQVQGATKYESDKDGVFIESASVPENTEEGGPFYLYVIVSIPEDGLGTNSEFSGTFTWDLNAT